MSYGLIKRELILAKVEGTYGTDPTPVGSDAVLIRNVTFSADRLRMVDRAGIRSSLGTTQMIYGGSMAGISFECEVKGSGAAGTAPEIGPLLKACGLQETVTPATSVVYAPRSSSLESCTIYYFEAGAGSTTQLRHIIVGCRGNVSFSFRAGDIVVANFNLVGVRAAPTDQALATPTYDSTVPVAIKGLATTIGGVSGLVIQDYTLDCGNAVVVPDNLNASEGYGEVTFGSRDPTITLNRHNELVATLAPWADLAAGTARALASGTLGGTAGNRLALAAPQMHYRGIAPGNDNGIRSAQYTFGLHESASFNDEFSLTFT